MSEHVHEYAGGIGDPAGWTCKQCGARADFGPCVPTVRGNGGQGMGVKLTTRFGNPGQVGRVVAVHINGVLLSPHAYTLGADGILTMHEVHESDAHLNRFDIKIASRRTAANLEGSMAKNPKQTSKRVASDAGKTLRDPKSTKREKELAASDLSQAASKPKAKSKKK